MHVRLHERRVRPQVDIARRGGQEEAPELEDVARGVVEELGPVERSDGVAAEAKVDEIPPEGVIPVGIADGIGLLVKRIAGILGDADVGEAVHREGVLPLRLDLDSGEAQRRVAGGALGLPKYNCLPRSSDAESVYRFCGRHSILGGVVLRAELADLARRLERRDRLAPDLEDLPRRVLGEDVLAVDLLDQRRIGPFHELLDQQRGILVGGRPRGGVVHLVGVDRGALGLDGGVEGAAIPEIAADPDRILGVVVGALRAEGRIGVGVGPARAEPAGHDPGLRPPPQIDDRFEPRREARTRGVALGTGIPDGIRHGVVVEHVLPELLDGLERDDVRRRRHRGKRPAHDLRVRGLLREDSRCRRGRRRGRAARRQSIVAFSCVNS